MRLQAVSEDGRPGSFWGGARRRLRVRSGTPICGPTPRVPYRRGAGQLGGPAGLEGSGTAGRPAYVAGSVRGQAQLRKRAVRAIVNRGGDSCSTLDVDTDFGVCIDLSPLIQAC